MRRSPTRLISGLIAGLILLSPNIASAQDYTTGLVNHWTLDETTGSLISDTTTTQDATWVDNTGDNVAEETTAGAINTAISFDGADDYIATPNNTHNVNETLYTVALWARSDAGAAAGQTILMRGNADTCHYNPAITANRISDAGCGGGQEIATYTDLNDNNWHHLVVQRNGADANFYVDGVFRSNVTITSNPLSTNNSRVGFGALWHGGTSLFDNFLDGDIDDVRVYNRELTADDIAALYSGFTCTNPNGVTGEMRFNSDKRVMQYCNGSGWVAIGAKKTALSNGLVGHWGLDETTGTTAADLSGNGNDGTMTGGLDAATDSVSGAVDTALDFDGVSDFINISDPLGAEAAFTVSAWVKADSWAGAGEWVKIVNQTKDALTDVTFTLQNVGDTNNIHFAVRNSSDVIKYAATPNTLTTGTWFHLVGSYDGANIRLYIDSVEKDMTLQTGTLFDSNNILSIGNKWINGLYPAGSSSNELDGKIDDVRIYNRTLSASEIGELYALKPTCAATSTNLVGHWKLDEAAGTTATDSAGAHNGTLINMDPATDWLPTGGIIDGTVQITDGSNERIQIPFDDAEWDQAPDLTACSWFNPDNNQKRMFFRFYNTGNNANFVTLATGTNSGSVTSIIKVGTTIYTTSSTDLGAGFYNSAWHNACVTFDKVPSSNRIKLYVDGVLTAQNDAENSNLAFIDFSNTGRIDLGRYGFTSTEFTGKIDDVRAYDRALTTSEIEDLYGAGAGECKSKCSSPTGYMGEMIYNADYNAMQYCDGGDWIAMGRQGDGGAGCASPSGLEAEIRYNSDLNTIQYCEGDEWVSVIGQQ